ncbi:DNA-dependent protein kinase catalytic subunit-like isoform X1 [Vespa velutina]|uniref:DNA-dependent protein kinase catalytic subunit-like isoform X1 n=3 Tax=Vespa velutina TaxID=202808 RepID=UPI001FB4B000|nr:DNA-dependent protein kinase catalytic subunit-like isoform X1 [Vespa velutina]
MESFTSFMDIFRRCVQENNTDDLVDFLKDSRKYFQSLTKEESKQALLNLFNSDSGLLSFLKNEFDRPVSRKNFDKVVKEVFLIIEFIIEHFHMIFHQYILPIKAICQLALIMHCSVIIKKAACSTLNKLIETFEENKLNLDETIEEFMSKFNEKYKLNFIERSFIFSVFGTIAQYHPQISQLQRYKNNIFILLFNDFKSQYSPSLKNQRNEIQIYLEVLTNILNNLCETEEIDSEYYAELYKWIKYLSMPNENSPKKYIMRAAIILLSRHMNLFSTFVCNDYEHWHILFTNLTKEKDTNGQCGQQALKAYYNNFEIMLRSSDEEKNKTMFLYFKNLLKEQLMDPALDPNSLRLVVYGFSKLAAPCKRYFSNEVKDMYLLIARYAVPLCLRENVEHTQFENINDYQEALSEILLYVSDVSIGQIKLLIKISVFSIKRYPDFSGMRKTYVISSLIKTIINIASINKILLDEFLYNIILDGIVWTCSHTLQIDAELQRELHNLSECPICYKNYLPLWTELLKPNRYKYGKILIAQQVFDKIINVYIMLLTKINLNTKIKEDCILSDAALSQIAENETDFRIFLNMVDLMIDIIDQMEPFLLKNTIHKFLYEIIRMSYRYPLISGFYKLVHAIIKNSEIFALDNEDDNDTEIRELVHKYLINTLDQIISFSNELFTACLYLIMCMPITYVANVLNRTIPTFKIAIMMSLNDFDLASVILDTLEKWISHLNREDTKDFLLEIIPNLELFLQSKESSTELLQDIIKSERKVIKHITLIDNDNTLESLQRRILLFFGSLDCNVLSDVVYRRALNTGSTWDKKDLLKCTLLFPDLSVEFHFDKIFPRLITLAQSSGDRRTKVIASELLHKMVSFILGKTKQHLRLEDIDRFATLYEALFPVLLDLSCDSDEVVWKLFQPLMIQLSHWLSSQFMSNSLATDLFINSLFNGLCNNGKSSVREFSGLCLAEFTNWSLRQLSKMNELNIYVNSIITKITNFAIHPSKCKRIAAATAFNHLYRFMREHEEIITTYWLELLYCFIKSLEECNDISIHNALNHINKVIQIKEDLLNEDHPQCRKPSAFTGRTLTDAVNWLFTQCGSLDPNCRQKSMELFVQISKCLFIYNSPIEFIESYIEKNGIQAINCIILKDLKLKGEDISFQNMLLLLKSLDCYMWLINKKLIDINYLFTDINPEKDVIFDYIKNFIHLLLKVKIQTEDKVVISKEVEQLQTLQCKIIMTIFDFIKILLNLNSNIIPDFFLNEELFELIAKCVICPQVLGFDMRNITIKEQLPLLLEQLLQVLVQKMNESLQYSFKRKIENYVMKHCTTFLTLHRNNDTISTEIKEYVKGLIILENCNILSQLCKDQKTFENLEHNVEYIFNSLSKKEAGILVCVSFHSQTIEYLQSVMELFLTNCKPSMTKKLINLIGNNDMLFGLDSIEISYGEYFLSTFKDIIFGYILKDIEETMTILENLLQTNTSFALIMLEELMLFTQHHKNKFKDNIEPLVTTIIKKFITLNRAVNNIESRKEKLINIYGISVHLLQDPIKVVHMSEYFYQWILKEFATEKIDIEYKTKLLENFLVCLTDMSSTYKPELVTILHTLRKDRLSISQNILSKHSIDAMKIKNCFYMLLTLLPITKSLIVFETIIFFAAGGGEYLFTEKLQECMKKYFNTIPCNCVLKSLEMCYKYFMDLNSFGNDSSSRFDILQKFLLPIFQFCNITEIEQFYENNIKDIYTIITKDLIGNNIDKQQLIISTIGCYELVAIMFAKIDILKITGVESKITRNAIDDINTGKELLLELYKSTVHVRSLRTDNPEHKEIMRLLQCSAYNCSIAIVSLKDEEEAYMSVFGENRSKNMLIWENIIDLDKKYNIQQTIEYYSKNQKKLINIRNFVNQQFNMKERNYSYIYSYNIAESTLNEDLNVYDLNETNIIHKSNNNNKEESMSLLFESDDLNDHECMPSICGVLIHMISKEIYNISDKDNLSLPKLLKCFHGSMLIQGNNNIRLFMLKVILNTSQLFEHYAKFFLLPVMVTINSYLNTNKLNYIITDALLTLIDWHKVAIPNETKEKVYAQKLFEGLLQKVLISDDKNTRRAIYKYNVNIIRMMVKVWQPCLKVPTNLNEIMINTPKAAIHLILICLANNMHAEIIYRDDILEFLQKIVENWQTDEEMILQSCEALGIIFKFFKSDVNYSTKLHDIAEKLRSFFRQMQMKFENRQIRCIQALCKNYPDLAIEYIEFITLNMSRVDSMGKAICLELFLLTIPKLSKEQIIKELNYIKFHDILKNRIALREKIALQIIHALVLILEPLDLLPLAKLVSPYVKHDFSEYREIVYKIFMNIYNRYLKITPYDNNIEELMYVSKQILLEGLLDPAIELQTKILNFWTEDNNLANKTTDRLLEILNIYSPNIEDVFLPFISLTMLHLLTKTVQYKSKMFDPLTTCVYKNYEIVPSWKIKNVGSVAPLFASSLASQMTQVFTQTISSIDNFDYFYTSSQNSNINIKLRATEDPQFEPTYLDEDRANQMFLNDMQYDRNLQTSKILQPADNKRSQRFVANQSVIIDFIKQKEITKNSQHAEMIKKEAIRQRNSVKLCREYRLGDFPDIEITLSDLTESLQNLIKKDQLICKDITVTMFSSFIEAIKNQQDTNILNDIISILKQILCNCQGRSSLMAAVLETMFSCHIIDCSPDITAKISKANNFNSIATLLLEENLIYYSDDTPPPQKRIHLIENEINEQTNKWIQLAKLYESMNETDIVLSIFRDKIDNKHLQESSFARVTSDWIRGKSAYETVYTLETGLIKEHCLQGLFECLSHLSDWDEINKYIKDRLDKNFENIWNDTWKNWMFPWMFQVYVHKSLLSGESLEFNEFKEVLNVWFEDEQKLSYIKRNFGEDIALFFLNEDRTVAHDFLNAALDELREEWIHLHPLSVQLKKKKLEKLHGISDIDLFLKYLKVSETTQGAQDLLRFWSKSIPSIQDDLLLWNKLILYRTNFTPLYIKHITSIMETDTQSDEEYKYINELQNISYQLSLDMINMSISYRNKSIASEHFSFLKKQIDFCSPQIKHKYILTTARLKYLKGEDESVIDKKLSYYVFSWKYSHKILYQNNLDILLHIATRQHISMLATRFVQLSYENAQFADILFKNDIILKELCVEFSNIENIRNLLESYSFNKIKECCSIGNKKDCYFILSKYCYDQLCKFSNNINFFKEFVNSTLKAMSYGSVDAAHYFPCLLKYQYLNNDEVKEIFISNTNEIQSWLFLRWQAQLFSHLGTSIADLIIPIIERIIQDYPNALIYTLRLTIQTNPSVMNDSRMYKIRQFLYDNRELEQFLEAMQYVVQPESYLQYYLHECIKNLSKGPATAIDMLLKKIYPSSRKNRNEPRPGNTYGIFKNSKFNLTRLETMKDEKEIRQYLQIINETLKQSFKARKISTLLKDYSPWLCEFNESHLEVPGQYTGYRKPMPQYHTKIMKIEPIVKVMESLRKPVRITIVGDDAKDYMFLNKFGEDLRLDQRLQQTFSIINKTLNTDIACKQRHLFIDTYQVIPLSTSLGLIQWIKNTKPLQDLISFTIPENKRLHYETIETDYTAWIKKAGSSGKLAVQYKEATLKYDANAVTIQMNKLIAKTEWDLLRKTCIILCPSPESFITFRRNFITSYATMCAVHWILGIGDRHLSNILISIGSGKCLGIDFDQAFDAGIDSMIPQLMPFRLTPQILGLLKPFTEKDLFGATMIHVLKALQCDKSAILACLDVFIHEPLNWTESVNKALERVEEVNTDVKWLPQKRISIVEKKLNGNKPSIITLEQLKDLYSDQYFDRYYVIVNGNDGIKRIRFNMRDDKLTAEEQVECLLDQATDLNILGRTFVGWKPWL